MSGTESKPDFEMFRGTLIKLERLIGNWTKQATDLVNPFSHSHAKILASTIGDGINHTLLLLIELNVNTTESNAIEELEHLVTIKNKISRIPIIYSGSSYMDYCASKDLRLSTQVLLQQLVESKIAFLKGGTFSRLVSEGGVEPMTALDRLTEIQMKLRSVELSEFLISRTNEVVYICEEKPLTQVVTASSPNVVDPVHNPQKQEKRNRGLFGECKEPKTTATSASIPSSSLENQTETQMQWLLIQNKVLEEWILKQVEPQTKLDVDSQLRDVDKVHKQLIQDQKKANMEWLQRQNGAHMGWIRDQNKINMKWLQDPVEDHTKEGDVDSSEEDGGELTPTSTITSG